MIAAAPGRLLLPPAKAAELLAHIEKIQAELATVATGIIERDRGIAALLAPFDENLAVLGQPTALPELWSDADPTSLTLLHRIVDLSRRVEALQAAAGHHLDAIARSATHVA